MKPDLTNRLAGKIAIVTGAARGLGAGIAKRLAAEGASVAITYGSSARQADDVIQAIEAAGGKGLALKADAGDPSAVRAAVARTVKTFGGLDILVNNAGIYKGASIEEFSLADFDLSISVNVRGVFIATQEAARHMKSGGRIIHIGSVNADRMPFAGGGVYALTNAAVAGFTRGVARDLGPRGISVNNIHPGPVDTDMNPAHGEFAESLKALMAIKRYGQTDEIAGLVAYLASAESAFITGASLTIDGGFAA